MIERVLSAYPPETPRMRATTTDHGQTIHVLPRKGVRRDSTQLPTSAPSPEHNLAIGGSHGERGRPARCRGTIGFRANQSRGRLRRDDRSRAGGVGRCRRQAIPRRMPPAPRGSACGSSGRCSRAPAAARQLRPWGIAIVGRSGPKRLPRCRSGGADDEAGSRLESCGDEDSCWAQAATVWAGAACPVQRMPDEQGCLPCGDYVGLATRSENALAALFAPIPVG